MMYLETCESSANCDFTLQDYDFVFLEREYYRQTLPGIAMARLRSKTSSAQIPTALRDDVQNVLDRVRFHFAHHPQEFLPEVFRRGGEQQLHMVIRTWINSQGIFQGL